LLAELNGVAGMRPRIEETLMMWPLPRCLKCGKTSCTPYNIDLMLIRIMSSMSSSVSAVGRRVIPRPTLLTSTSM